MPQQTTSRVISDNEQQKSDEWVEFVKALPSRRKTRLRKWCIFLKHRMRELTQEWVIIRNFFTIPRNLGILEIDQVNQHWKKLSAAEISIYFWAK